MARIKTESRAARALGDYFSERARWHQALDADNPPRRAIPRCSDDYGLFFLGCALVVVLALLLAYGLVVAAS